MWIDNAYKLIFVNCYEFYLNTCHYEIKIYRYPIDKIACLANCETQV